MITIYVFNEIFNTIKNWGIGWKVLLLLGTSPFWLATLILDVLFLPLRILDFLLRLPTSTKNVYETIQKNQEVKNGEVVIDSARSIIGNEKYSFCRLEKVTLPDTLIEIGEGAFMNNYLTEIKIPQSVKKINNRTFTSNKLTKIDFPNSVEYIGVHAFSNNSIGEITIPNSVKVIDDYAFLNNNITYLSLPNSVNKVGISAFTGCILNL